MFTKFWYMQSEETWMFMGKIIKKITALVLAISMLAGCSAETLPEVSEPVDKAEENLVDNEKMPDFSVTRGTFSYAGMFNEEKDATAESPKHFSIDEINLFAIVPISILHNVIY